MIVGVVSQHSAKPAGPALVSALDPVHGLAPLPKLGISNDDTVGGTATAEVLDKGIVFFCITEKSLELPFHIAEPRFGKSELLSLSLQNLCALTEGPQPQSRCSRLESEIEFADSIVGQLEPFEYRRMPWLETAGFLERLDSLSVSPRCDEHVSQSIPCCRCIRRAVG